MRSNPLEFGVLLSGDLPTNDVIALAKRMEEYGFSDLYHADERFSRDVYGLLAPVAMATETLTMGPLTADPYSRHPAVQAMAIATLAEISGGRAVLGFGPGSSGLTTMGIERTQVRGRIREALDLIRKILTATENFTHEGEFFTFRNDHMLFGPVPHVPFVIGTRGPKMLQLGGEIADGVNIGGYGNPATIQWALDHIDVGVQRAGRPSSDLRVIVMTYACLHDDRAIALDASALGDARRAVEQPQSARRAATRRRGTASAARLHAHDAEELPRREDGSRDAAHPRRVDGPAVARRHARGLHRQGAGNLRHGRGSDRRARPAALPGAGTDQAGDRLPLRRRGLPATCAERGTGTAARRFRTGSPRHPRR